ncbi:MAG TPA: hypothetical protein VJ951_14350 [Bacteroidales bacterium]|nr:hypothetical protein [Bacteroidales bacterium]
MKRRTFFQSAALNGMAAAMAPLASCSNTLNLNQAAGERYRHLGESIKQPLSFTRIANIVSSTGAKVGTNTIINYMEYAREAWLINPIQNNAGKLVDKETVPKFNNRMGENTVTRDDALMNNYLHIIFEN